MGTVDESKWIGRCPRCGDTDTNSQYPVTIELLLCHWCKRQAIPPDKGGKDIVQYYRCNLCGQRYLTPNIPPEEYLLRSMEQ